MTDTIEARQDSLDDVSRTPDPGHPSEQMEVREPVEAEDIIYPTGYKLTMAMVAIMSAAVLRGLDMTILAAAVPSITNDYKTVADIGWYSSAYTMVAAGFGLTSSKCYTLFSVKRSFLAFFTIFEIGSLLCTVAPTSNIFILGRAITGLGGGGMGNGSLIIVSHCFPNHRRPFWTAVLGAAQMVGIVSSPLIGGALIDALSWRACFGINLPFALIVFGFIIFGYKDVSTDSDTELPWKVKAAKFDIIGTVLVVPSITCLLIALQWGGTRYGYSNPRIIVLLGLFALLFGAFCYRQYQRQDAATVPPRLLKNRSVLAGTWFSACANSTLAVTEYYMSVYFQGVKGYSAVKSGTLLVPMLIGIFVGSVGAGFATGKIGYYNPFMIGTTILAPVASGLLTTLDLDEEIVKVLCYLGLLGFAVGVGMLAPINVIQTTMAPKDLPLALGVLSFGGYISNAVWIVVSASLFQNRLEAEVRSHSPGTNTTQLANVGLSDIRHIVGPDRLQSVLLGYDEAVTQTLYLPLALTCASILGTGLMKWSSVKKKSA